MKGAGFCSLYREFHYIAIRYIEVWAYIVTDIKIVNVWDVKNIVL